MIGEGTDRLLGIERVLGSRYGDQMTGDGGFNALYGVDGNDTIVGGSGNDAIQGGDGADRLTGGIGADTFSYNQLDESPTGAVTRDIITDFTARLDRINLSIIDAQATAAGNQAFTFATTRTAGVEGQVVATQSPSYAIVSIYVDGDNLADMQIQLTGTITLTANDFVL
jgi:Ca2+-binding RTX toxin-like protein